MGTPETIIGWIFMVIVNIIGWLLVAWRNKNSDAKDKAGEAKEYGQVLNAIKALAERFNTLPCVRSADYERDMGALQQRVESVATNQCEFKAEMMRRFEALDRKLAELPCHNQHVCRTD